MSGAGFGEDYIESCPLIAVCPFDARDIDIYHQIYVKFRQVIEILKEYNITFLRNGKGSHEIYEGTHSGRPWVAVLSYDQLGGDVPKGNLDSANQVSPRRFRR
jgi:hypothetical protein